VNRRNVLVLFASASLWPARVVAQQSGRVPIVGLLITHPPANDPVSDSLRRGLKQYGYEDGRNIRVEVRTPLGRLDRVPDLAQELVRLPADVIVVVNEVALRAVQQATSAIPIVMIGWTGDPVALGVIESYRRPGGNVTGFFSMPSELVGKRLEILKEALPRVARVAVFWDTFGQPQLDALDRAAKALNLRLEPIEFRRADDLPGLFVTARRKKAGAVLMTWSPIFYVHREKVAQWALDAGLPTVTDSDIIVEAGCLLSYGFSVLDNFERAGYFVDRILRGAKPAELPVEQISQLKLAVNLKTAKVLGITLPESILLRADEVIQ